MGKSNIFLEEETVLGINKYVRLRQEKSGVILYWSVERIGIGDEIDSSKMSSLSSSTAMILALFDGKRSLKEIFQAVKYIWDNPPLTFIEFCKELEQFTVKKAPPLNLEAPVLIEVTKDNIKQKIMHYAPESFVIKGDKISAPELMTFKFPITLGIMPSMKCFTDCIYCYMGRHMAPKYSSLPFSRWKELLSEMEEYQLGEIAFGGGDPMCYEYIVDMLEIIGTFNPPTVITLATKSYISTEVARRLSKIPRLELQISLDSTDPKIADAMTQRKGYGEKAIESIKNCLSAGLSMAVKAVVTPLNIKAMPQTILDLHNLGVYPVRAALYGRSMFRHKDELFNKTNEYEEFERSVKEIQAKHGFKVQLQGGYPQEDEFPEQPEMSWKKRSRCTAGREQVVILPDGSLIGCEQIPQIPEYFFGSVAKDSLYDVWNSESFKKKAYDIPMEKYKGTACYGCKEFKECHSAFGQGYCMRESYRLYGTIYAPSPGCPYTDKKLPRQQ
ncbi:radical SAM protein [bacterium]|nr:radical SAM protein [bacterium]